MAWLESDHPRKAAGAGGGQFTLAYDSASNTGTGYDKRNGDARVKAAQKALNAGGMTDGKGHRLKLDGKLGPRTTAALKKYQRAHGMSPTGKITPGLLKRLKVGGKRRTLRKSAGHRAAIHHKPKAKTPTPKARAKPAKPLKRPPTVMRTDDTKYDRLRASTRRRTFRKAALRKGA